MELNVPSGELRLPRLPGVSQGAVWARDSPGNYSLVATTVTASHLLGAMRYIAIEDVLTTHPMRIPLTVTAFAIPMTSSKDRGVLRDRRVMHLELDPEPALPKVQIAS